MKKLKKAMKIQKRKHKRPKNKIQKRKKQANNKIIKK